MLIGKVEKVVPATVAGWIRVVGWLADAERETGKVKAELFVNGVRVRGFSADQPARARPGAEMPRGARLFSVSVPSRWGRPGRNAFAVGGPEGVLPSVEALDAELDPAIFPPEEVAASPAASLRGRIQRVEAGALHGWLWNPEVAGPVRFLLYANDRELGEFVADQQRPDLIRKNIGDGRHAFRVRLRREWLSERTTFTLCALPGRERLPDALTLDAPPPIEDDEAPPPAPRKPEASRARSTAPERGTGPITPAKLLEVLQGWPTRDLVDFVQRIEAEVLYDRGRNLLRAKNWEELSAFLPISLPARGRRTDFDVLVGRGLLYRGQAEKAAEILSATARSAPDNANALFYAAVACSRTGLHFEAARFGREALALAPANTQYLLDHGANCRRLAASLRDKDQEARTQALEESIRCHEAALRLAPEKLEQCLLANARSLLELDRAEEAVVLLRRLEEQRPRHVASLSLLSEALVATNRVKEALAVAERILEVDPLHQGARFQLRALQSLAGDEETREQSFGIARWHPSGGRVSIELFTPTDDAVAMQPIADVEFATKPVEALASLKVDWIALASDGQARLPDPALLRRLRAAATSWPGRLVAEQDGAVWTFWRRSLLVSLAESGICRAIAEMPAELAGVEDIVATSWIGEGGGQAVDLPAMDGRLAPGPVIAMSRHGSVKFGGGEHFIASMAQHYRDMGHDPIIVGTRPERVGEEGEADGVRTAFVAATPAALRRYFLSVRPRFVHVLSGLGYEVAEALAHLDIPYVYGVHFWRDCLGSSEHDPQFFSNHDRDPIPRPAFRYIVETAATVYSNSEFTQEVLQSAFGMRTPVIYSLPEDVNDLRPGTEEEANAVLGSVRDYVLLVNARSDKGFDLILQTAKLAPHVPFLVIASQTENREAQSAIAAAGLRNVHLIGYTSRMDIVYSRARVVTVPSYAFIETFSRVCIEAQRHAKPVIGSTTGNVPYLLKRSGIILPEDAEAWAKEITRLYADEAYYGERVALALENERAYGHEVQRDAIAGVVSTLARPVLIGVGSGIGNMLHVGPMIRNIARRLGRKVDLVMTEDHKNGHFILQNDAYVNAVYSLSPEVLRRRYDTVFITHSFGKARLPFQARHVIYARDWENFEPAGPYHETIYNLESAKALLGIPYEAEDVHGYYIGNQAYRPPAGGTLRIAFHGGSKDGFWRSKRWPHYELLAQRLQARGWEVLSFGIAEEYVPGTVDRTGGSIAEMTASLCDVHYLVSNDSGVMNIANALGLPVMALFGPTNPATRGPLGAKSRWLAIEKECAPCEVTKAGRATFQAGECQCIAELPVDLVERSILEHLAELGLLERAAA